jgi:hypothetical protein
MNQMRFTVQMATQPYWLRNIDSNESPPLTTAEYAIDANQPAIVKALRAMAASVQSLADLGHGVPDLLVGWRGINVLMEVKGGSRAPSTRRLTPDEAQWHQTWHGVDDAFAIVGISGRNEISSQYGETTFDSYPNHQDQRRT